MPGRFHLVNDLSCTLPASLAYSGIFWSVAYVECWGSSEHVVQQCPWFRIMHCAHCAQINACNGGAEVSSCCFWLPLERAGGNSTSRGCWDPSLSGLALGGAHFCPLTIAKPSAFFVQKEGGIDSRSEVRGQLYVSTLLSYRLVCWCRTHPGFLVWPGLFVNCLTRSGACDIYEDEVGAFVSVAEDGNCDCRKISWQTWINLLGVTGL